MDRADLLGRSLLRPGPPDQPGTQLIHKRLVDAASHAVHDDISLEYDVSDHDFYPIPEFMVSRPAISGLGFTRARADEL